MRYWGGSSPGSGKCKCALKDECKVKETACNCDSGISDEFLVDDGFLRHKEHLPVMELRFGDTGIIGDHKKGYHELGPLRCMSDSEYDLHMTFRNLWERTKGLGCLLKILKNCLLTCNPSHLCRIGLFENVVTFRKADATIEFPPFDAATSGDIRFEFKTTNQDGIFLQNTGTFNFIEVKLVCKWPLSTITKVAQKF